MSYHLHTQDAPPLIEDPRVQWRRRLQQRRCLVCGARQLHYHSILCDVHFVSHRWCAECETARLAAEHGRDRRRCRRCALAGNNRRRSADPDRLRYTHALRRLAQRRVTVADAVLATAARRIALAELVRHTPHATWPERARLIGYVGDWRALRSAWVRQQSDDLHDPDWRQQ